MRAKRDGLATGIRFIQTPGDAPLRFSQCQYIQQPDPSREVRSRSLAALTASPTGRMCRCLRCPEQFVISQWQHVSAIAESNPTLPAIRLPIRCLRRLFLPYLQLCKILGRSKSTTSIHLGWSTYRRSMVSAAGRCPELRDGGVYSIAGVITPAPNTFPQRPVLQIGRSREYP